MTSQSRYPSPAVSPSDWILRFAPLVPPGAQVLDVACGGGRHGRLFLATGCAVTFVDRDCSGVMDLGGQANLIAHDLEHGPDGAEWSWPFLPEQFDLIIVTNYLHRPLFPALLASLRPDGFLLYETFAVGNERFGRPRNPAHLLAPGELLDRIAPLHIIAYETGILSRGDHPRVVARVAARKGKDAIALPIIGLEP